MADSPLIHDEQPHNPESRQRPTLLARWFDDWWLGELLAVLFSCALVGTLYGVLTMYNKEPVPSFATSIHGGITLGTLVTLLVNLSVATSLSVVQACISQLKWRWYANTSRPLGDIETYDRASRSLIGSLLLLWKLRLTPTASFGALLVIANAAIGPLAQQSLSYPSVPMDAKGELATVAAARSWVEDDQQPQSPNMTPNYDSLSTGMKGAILNGVFAGVNTTVKDTIPACSSGNCTFPDYQSLAFCALAVDVSSHLQAIDSNDQWCLPHGICTNSGTISFNLTSAANNVNQEDELVIDGNQNLYRKVPLNYTSVAFADHVTPVGDFYIFYKNMTTSDWGAVEFVIDWCIPTFSTEVTNGTAVTTRRPQPFMAFDAPPESITGRPDGGGDNDPNTFTISSITHYTLQRYMALTLSGLVNVGMADTLYAEPVDSDVVQKFASLYNVFGPIHNITSAMGLAALNDLLGNVTTSMTNYVRVSMQDNNANGTVSTQHTIVRVDWPFLAAPIVFSAASVLFFLAVVVLGSGGGGGKGQDGRPDTKPPLWKSSAVAAMRCLDPALQHDLGGPPGRTSSLETNEQQHVRLVREGDGWLLSRGASCTGDGVDWESRVALGNQRGHQEASDFAPEKGPPSS